MIFLIAAALPSLFTLDRAEEIDPEIRKVEALLKDVNALSEAWRFDQGIEVGRQALEASKKRFGDEAPLTARILHALGDCYYRKEAFEEGLTLWRQALVIQEKSLGPAHPETAGTLNSLALGYRALGEYDLAEGSCVKSLEIRKAELPPDHPDIAESLCTLAILYEDQSKFEKSGRSL